MLCLSNNNWLALKYCITSLQNMCLVTKNYTIHELAIQIGFQANLTDRPAVNDSLTQIRIALEDLKHEAVARSFTQNNDLAAARDDSGTILKSNHP